MAVILVTGSEGFIGRRLVERLVKNGHEVIGVSRRSVQSFRSKSYRYLSLDITEPTALRRISDANAIDVVFHLAGLTTHEELVAHPVGTLKANVASLMNVLEFFSSTPATRFVFASTGKVYGHIKRLPIREDHPVRPRNVLGTSKRVAEALIEFFARDDSRQYATARIFNVYGPGQRDYFLVPTILRQVLAGSNDVTLGSTDMQRDYIFLEDAVAALLALSTAPLDMGVNYVNVGSSVPVTPKDIVDLIAEILGRPLRIVSDPTLFRTDEDLAEFADVSRLSSMGWSQEHDLRAGLAETIKAYTVR